MTPHDIIYGVLERRLGIHEAEKLATEIMERLAAQAFVVVHASAVVREDGKVTVTRKLVEGVLEHAEEGIRREYLVDGRPHPALENRYVLELAGTIALRNELQEQANG